MIHMPRSSGVLVLRLIVGLALPLAAPLLAAPPAPMPHPDLVLQVGHSGGINTFAYSPDGQTLATGGSDGVRLWDLASGQVKAALQGGTTSALAFSPDGRALAAGSDGGTVDLSDATSGQLKATLNPGAAWSFSVESLAFSPDGRTLATAGTLGLDCGHPRGPGPVQLWDVASGQPRATLKGSAVQIAFSADG